MAFSTSAASVALILLAGAALAQAQPDPRRIDPLTGEPRRLFEPTSGRESKLVLDACLERELARATGPDPVPGAVQACHAEALAPCGAIMALYPLARDTCALGVRLAWGDVRFEVGQAVGDLLRGQDPAAAERFWAEDDAWRVKGRDACPDPDAEAREACELGREQARAALYLARARAIAGL